MRQKELADFESSGVECPTCGKGGFDCVGDMKKHHAHAHDESIAGESVKCDNCGEEFRRCQSHLDEQAHNFCSEKCHGEFRSEYYTGEKNPFWSGGGVELTCEQCGDSYTRVPAEAEDSRFCSYECLGKWNSEHRTGENHPNWQGGKAECECDFCGKTYYVKQKELNRTRFCSYECKAEWQEENVYGPDHHQWEGGYKFISQIRRSIGPHAWPTISEEVREEANYQCEQCGEKKQKGEIHAHHIIPLLYGGTNHRENIMALCEECHASVEAYTKSIFKDEFKITEFGGEPST